MGRVFWLGALGRERWTLEERLHSLERKEFVAQRTRGARWRARTSTPSATRSCATSRTSRSREPSGRSKHRASGEWIESLGRSEDHAEMLAHHYGAALDYARATGRRTPDRRPSGLGLALRDAGDRALALNAFASAARYYERAVELWPRRRRRTSCSCATDAHSPSSGDDRRGAAARAGARRAPRRADDTEARRRHTPSWPSSGTQGRGDSGVRAHRARVELVRDAPASPAKARVLTESSRLLALAGGTRRRFAIGEQALRAWPWSWGSTSSRPARSSTSVSPRGSTLDGEGGIEDLERGIELASRRRLARRGRARVHNLGIGGWSPGRPRGCA